MRKHPVTSPKAQTYNKHLKPFGKRLANKGTRRVGKREVAEVAAELIPPLQERRLRMQEERRRQEEEDDDNGPSWGISSWWGVRVYNWWRRT